MANYRNNYCEDLWSSDDSEDDDYNYLKALDNLNWNTCRRDTGVSSNSRPIERRNVARNGSKPASRAAMNQSAKPAVAVKSKSNRNDFLLKDIIASESDKTKDKSKAETDSDSKKRDFDLMEDNEDFDDIVIPSVDDSKDKNSNKDNKSDSNSSEPKNKRTKVDDTAYDIIDVVNQKKANHQKIVSNNNNKNSVKSDLNRVKNSNRLFGKAFSPTVYSPEVPVMQRSIAPQISDIHVIQKALTFSEDSTALEDSRFSPNRILTIILDWNTKWLQECGPNEVPNLLSPFGEGIGLKTCYESLEEYQSAYIPLILFETWAQVYKDYISSVEKDFHFETVRGPEINSDSNFLKLCLQTVVPKSRVHLYPAEGQLLLLELTTDYGANNEKRKVVLFAYVNDFVCLKVTSSVTLPPGIAMPSSQGNPQLLKYFVVLSKKPMRISSGQKINVRPIHYLKPTMRQIDLISNLHTSPLFKDILKPRLFTCQVVVPSTVSLNAVNFNNSQNRAIVGSSEALSRPYAVPKVLFIQGPPGTGKTHTLIGIIKYIYLHWDKEDRLPRILICAPSNGAVDEISRRLYRERHFLIKHKVEKHSRPLRCVRVGKESQIHPDARQILFETLIKDNSDNEKKRLNDQKEKKTKELEKKMSKLDQDLANYRANKQTEELRRAEKEAQVLMFEMQKISTANSKDDSEKDSKSRLRIDIMIKADIVLSTLNSSHSAPIEKLYNRFGPKTFDCVIVDEASQCSEPELLMPLAYKMTKMILIGDPMQLPATVISKKASSLQLGRSLFERFFHFFREREREDPKETSPILMLTEQYRMHPQICHFPSKHFYDGKLVSNIKVQKSRESKLKPYIVFDITDSLENKKDPTNKYNELEAGFVIRLVNLIDDLLDSTTIADNRSEKYKYSVGIITPYNGQKSYFMSKLSDKTFKNIILEVNTVDGFQGQERDVIILSAVRAFDNQVITSNKWQTIGFLDSTQRMNVALTRAKYSMICCISGRSLETNKDWKSLIDDGIRRVNCRFKVPSTLNNDKLKRMLSAIETISIAD